MAKPKSINYKKKGLSLEDAKKSHFWMIIPIDKLPNHNPVIAISQYPNKDIAKFHLVEEVIVPIPTEMMKKIKPISKTPRKKTTTK